MKQRVYIIISALLVLALLGLVMWQFLKPKTKESYCGASHPTRASVAREDFELVNDSYGAAPSADQMAGVDGQRCKIGEAEMLGYKYQVPEKLPSVEELLPEESACGSYYDPEAAQVVPYTFTYPLAAALTKTRAEQAGDIFRGDLNIAGRDPAMDFAPIYNMGDQLVHGAFSDYTKKSHELVGCDNINKGVWVRDAPIRVANEELIMDYE